MANWDDLTDPNRKIAAAKRNRRNGIIHALLRAPFTPLGYRSYCGDLFSCDELLIMLQRLEDITCPICFERLEARKSFRYREDECLAQMPILAEKPDRCPKCGGLLREEELGEYHCLCGKIVYTK